eukprot:scaffold2744_cov160-Amphora_coffeaeformis.AAC.6
MPKRRITVGKPLKFVEEFRNVKGSKMKRSPEEERRAIYCLAWSPDLLFLPQQRKQQTQQHQDQNVSYFAAVGGRFISLYYYTPSQSLRDKRTTGKLNVLKVFADNDRDEDFFCCAFGGRSAIKCSLRRPQKDDDHPSVTEEESILETPTPKIGQAHQKWPLADCTGDDGANLLCVAGTSKVIKVLDLWQQKYIGFLFGHGDSILDLKVCPIDRHMLASACNDKSFRLWNLRTGTCVAIFAGPLAHADFVVSIDWHLSGHYIVSGSMDTTVKIWNTGPGSAVHDAMRQSHQDADKWREEELMCVVEPLIVVVPLFSSQDLHFHCVDCVQFVGDMVLSRSPSNVEDVDSDIFLWEPIFPESKKGDVQPSSRYDYIWTFSQEKAWIWFLRFTTDSRYRLLACGNCEGDVDLWDMSAKSSIPFCTLKTRKFHGAVRWLSFSPKNDFMVGLSDDATLWNDFNPSLYMAPKSPRPTSTPARGVQFASFSTTTTTALAQDT